MNHPEPVWIDENTTYFPPCEPVSFRWNAVPFGPERVVYRILPRTHRVRFWIPYDKLMVALASHGRKRK